MVDLGNNNKAASQKEVVYLAYYILVPRSCYVWHYLEINFLLL